MKLPSFLRENNGRRSFPRSADRVPSSPTSAITLIFVLGGVFFIGLRLLAPGAFIALTSPLLRAGTSLTAAVVTAGQGGTSAVTKERDELAIENTALTNENAMLSARVNDLSTLLGTQQTPQKGIIAGVLARPPVSPYDVLILDQGSAAGVRIDALVSGPGGIPAGRITDVQANSSRVTLFSMIGASTAGWVGANRFPVTYTGDGSGAFTTTVTKGGAVAVGDGAYVVAGGAQPIGVVIAIDSDPSSPNEQLRIRPFINPFSLTMVTIAPPGER